MCIAQQVRLREQHVQRFLGCRDQRVEGWLHVGQARDRADMRDVINVYLTSTWSADKGGDKERMLLTIWNECRYMMIVSRMYSLFAKRKSSCAVVSCLVAASSRHWEGQLASEQEPDAMTIYHRNEPLLTTPGACITQHLRRIFENQPQGRTVSA